jgi:hypothetical protein
MFGFDKEKLKKAPANEFMKTMGFSEYLCPKCGANLKEASDGDLICLNACHLSSDMQVRFVALMKKASRGEQGDGAKGGMVKRVQTPQFQNGNCRKTTNHPLITETVHTPAKPRPRNPESLKNEKPKEWCLLEALEAQKKKNEVEK